MDIFDEPRANSLYSGIWERIRFEFCARECGRKHPFYGLVGERIKYCGIIGGFSIEGNIIAIFHFVILIHANILNRTYIL